MNSSKRSIRRLLKRSSLKDFRDGVFHYLDYIQTISSPNKLMGNFARGYYTLQLWTASYFMLSSTLWPSSTSTGPIARMWSVLAFIIPIGNTAYSKIIISTVLTAYFLVLFIFFYITLSMFTKTARLSKSIASAACRVFDDWLPVFSLTSAVSAAFSLKEVILSNTPLAYLSLIMSLISLAMCIYMYGMILSSSLHFRPFCVPIMSSTYSVIYLLCDSLRAYLTTYASLSTGLTALIMGLLTIIPISVNFYIGHLTWIWPSSSAMTSFRSQSLISLVMSVFIPIYQYFGCVANEIILFSFGCSIFIVDGVYTSLERRRLMKSLATVDQIESNPEMLATMKEKNINSILYDGFIHGKPVCHNYWLFDRAFEIYPRSKQITITHARFASVYISDKVQVSNAILRMESIKKGDYELKHLLFQLRTLQQKRDRALTKDLSKSLRKMEEKTAKARNMVRYVWEKVLRGQVDDLDVISAPLREADTNNIRDFKQLCLINANNPRVFLSYANYLRNIACKFTESNLTMNIYNSMKNGNHTRGEKCLEFAQLQMPTMLDAEKHEELMYSSKISGNLSENRSNKPAVEEHTEGFTTEMTALSKHNEIQKMHLETMLSDIRLPSHIPTILVTIIFLIVGIPTLVIVFLVLFNNRIQTFSTATTIIEAVSKMRIEYANLLYLIHQYNADKAGAFIPIHQRWENTKTGPVPEFFENDLLAMRRSIARATDLENTITTSSTYIDTTYFRRAIELIYKRVLPVKYYTAYGQFFDENSSFQAMVTQAISTAVGIIDMSAMETFAWNNYWTILDNGEAVASFIGDISEELSKTFNIVCYDTFDWWLNVTSFSLGSILIVFISIYVYLLMKRSSEQQAIFRSFKSIPGSSIATILHDLATTTGDTNTSTKNGIHKPKAEENAIYLLKNIAGHKGGSSSSNGILIPLVFANIVVILLYVCLLVFANSSLNSFMPLSGQFYAVQVMHVELMQALTRNARIGSVVHPEFSVYLDDRDTLLAANLDHLNELGELFNVLRVARTDGSLGDTLSASRTYGKLLSQSEELPVSIFNNDDKIINGCSYENACMYLINYFRTLNYHELASPGTMDGNEDDQSLGAIWLLKDADEQYIQPFFDSISSTIENEVANMFLYMVLSSSAFLAILIILAIRLVVVVIESNRNTLWVYGMLLFCDPEVVLRSRSILKILANEFGQSKDGEDISSSSLMTYDKLISHLPDGVVFMTSDMIIRSANNSLTNVIGIDAESVIGKSLFDIIIPEPGKEASHKAFLNAVDAMKHAMRPPQLSMEVDVIRAGKPATLNFNILMISHSSEVLTQPTSIEGVSIICCTITDMTSIIASRTLLKNEHARGQHLLSSILPPIIVKKLQSGEKNISFAVPSSSVVFIDIVGFTPWCGSLPASTVMMTLNKLFAMLDNILMKYNRMTKIKCIGDCYMAAGGLFEEVNQPAQHAEQAISFCLDVIESMKIFNEEQKSELKVRAGVNTGGPIVGGVLGIDKPTFDILGPSISLAASMEHTGVPMVVQIPHHVYELVYDSKFRIKERGVVSVKGKEYRTYLVLGYATN